ncbi:MAG: hypothetical protein WC445_04695, partial [Patescibacteria group bacterium]
MKKLTEKKKLFCFEQKEKRQEMKFFLFLLTFLSTAFAQVELFEHSGGTPGRSWRLEKPGYYQSDLGNFGDNCVSSILIMDGWEVKLWEHPKSWNKGRTIELQS